MTERTPAETFPPGEFLKEELEARGWTQIDLAEILGRPIQAINEIIAGKKTITPDTAKELADALGTSAQFWLNLESTYQLGRAKAPDPAVTRRARLYELAPIKEMVKRGWIEQSSSVEVIEKQICQFFHIEALDKEPIFLRHAARKSTSYARLSPAQRAWLFRAFHLARGIEAKPFSDVLFEKGLAQLRQLMGDAEEARHIPRVLSESGVRFIVIEPLPQTGIDGVAFWFDAKSPVVALSCRYDRIDWFWFTLMHELAHVKNRDGLTERGEVDTNLVGQEAVRTDQKPEYEQEADKFAAEFLIPQTKIESFIVRVGPLYSKQKIKGFASVMQVHPGIVVGQLQRRDKISYAHNREMLAKVRHIVTSAALTDGWGTKIAGNI